MREKERIGRILEKIQKLWESEQDSRFYQLMINHGLMDDGPHWITEDDDFEKWVDSEISEIKTKQKK